MAKRKYGPKRAPGVYCENFGRGGKRCVRYRVDGSRRILKSTHIHCPPQCRKYKK